MKMLINKGEKIPEVKPANSSRYLIRLNEKIIISPLPLKFILEKIETCEFNIYGYSKKIYDTQKGALEDFIIEELKWRH